MVIYCEELNIMTRPSRAQTVRALRGITQEKNPKLVAAGKKRAAIAKAQREGVTVDEILKAQIKVK